MLAAVLKKSGYEVVETANGSQACGELHEPGAPPLAILDWMMPEMDGPEVVRRVRARKTDQPPYIIMLTTKGEKADIIAGLEAGADDYLAKPFNSGELRARVAVGRRILETQAELLTARNALAHEATHDPLTGILNRRAIETALSRELSREQRLHEGLTVSICDIDNFKKINDTYGHMAGDEVLCGIVRLLETRLRAYDHLGRFGGEEFLVITPGVTQDQANKLYERLRAAVSDNPISTKAGSVSITISIGVRAVNGNETMDELITAADSALYRAKREGRNRVCFDGEGPASKPVAD